MLVITHRGDRPAPGCHRHGTTPRTLPGLVYGKLCPILLLKQRWLHPDGTTTHDRPVWESPRCGYALDVVVLTLHTWLLAADGLHATDWPWDDSEHPSRRTVQRWAAALGTDADAWLHQARRRILDHVAPRPLEDLLPAGGIPPPEGARLRQSQGAVADASKLRDVVWLLKNAAQALCIPLRALLVVARWRWTRKP